MPCASCGSDCTHRRPWQQKTSSCGNSERSIRHAMPSPGAPLTPRTFLWSGSRSGSTGNKRSQWYNRRRPGGGSAKGSNSAGAGHRPLNGPRFRESCKRSADRWRTTISRGANGAWPMNCGPHSACRSRRGRYASTCPRVSPDLQATACRRSAGGRSCATMHVRCSSMALPWTSLPEVPKPC
jgi:hypothetical protein